MKSLEKETKPESLESILFANPKLHREWAKHLIKTRYGISNPPPWLICTITGESYKVG